MFFSITESIFKFLTDKPRAFAHIRGDEEHSQIAGLVTFFDFLQGTMVVADISGLPDNGEGGDFYGFHIHEGESCTGNAQDPFADAGEHYNPQGAEHPLHAGDMPVLMGNKGEAWMAFYTERFKPQDVRGRTVIVHDMPDDFRSQPSGDSGRKIACGLIQ